MDWSVDTGLWWCQWREKSANLYNIGDMLNARRSLTVWQNTLVQTTNREMLDSPSVIQNTYTFPSTKHQANIFGSFNVATTNIKRLTWTNLLVCVAASSNLFHATSCYVKLANLIKKIPSQEKAKKKVLVILIHFFLVISSHFIRFLSDFSLFPDQCVSIKTTKKNLILLMNLILLRHPHLTHGVCYVFT